MVVIITASNDTRLGLLRATAVEVRPEVLDASAVRLRCRWARLGRRIAR